MGFTATMIFYHLIGFGVAAAVFLSDPRQGRKFPVFRLATAVVFWPLYLPIVLAARATGAATQNCGIAEQRRRHVPGDRAS